MSADLDERTSKGFLPPAFIFDRVIADAQNQLKGAPFEAGPDVAVLADLKSKVAALQAEPDISSAGDPAFQRPGIGRAPGRYAATGFGWSLEKGLPVSKPVDKEDNRSVFPNHERGRVNRRRL